MKFTTIITTIFFLITLQISSQNTCNSKDENFEDLNAPAKCSIGNTKSKQLSVIVSSKLNKKHFHKKSVQITNIRSLQRKLSAKELKLAINFTKVDKVPLFKVCSNSNVDTKKCFNEQMARHIEKHFHYPEAAILNKESGKVWVRFIIDSNGNVSNIKAHDLGVKPSTNLEKEAARVVSHLPKFTPAKNNKKLVAIKYGFPIDFNLDH